MTILLIAMNLFKPLTISEANAFIPFIDKHFKKIYKLHSEGQNIKKLCSKNHLAKAHGKNVQEHTVALSLIERLEQIEHDIKNEIISIQSYGGFVKSIYPGIVNFIAKRHGQSALLNWQVGEKSVSYWLCPDFDFIFRQPIKDYKSFGDEYVH